MSFAVVPTEPLISRIIERYNSNAAVSSVPDDASNTSTFFFIPALHDRASGSLTPPHEVGTLHASASLSGKGEKRGGSVDASSEYSISTCYTESCTSSPSFLGIKSESNMNQSVSSLSTLRVSEPFEEGEGSDDENIRDIELERTAVPSPSGSGSIPKCSGIETERTHPTSLSVREKEGRSIGKVVGLIVREEADKESEQVLLNCDDACAQTAGVKVSCKKHVSHDTSNQVLTPIEQSSVLITYTNVRSTFKAASVNDSGASSTPDCVNVSVVEEYAPRSGIETSASASQEKDGTDNPQRQTLRGRDRVTRVKPFRLYGVIMREVALRAMAERRAELASSTVKRLPFRPQPMPDFSEPWLPRPSIHPPRR